MHSSLPLNRLSPYGLHIADGEETSYQERAIYNERQKELGGREESEKGEGWGAVKVKGGKGGVGLIEFSFRVSS